MGDRLQKKVLLVSILIENTSSHRVPSIRLLSKVAVGFSLDWSNHFRGSLCPVSWLSPEELRRLEDVVRVVFPGPEPALARNEASRVV